MTALSPNTPARFAVVACPCGQVWATETRHGQAACTSCGKTADLANRPRLWQGDSPFQAQQATATLRAQRAGASPSTVEGAPREPRHDTPSDAAAAQATGILNRSRRAETVADWMTRLTGAPTHDQLVDALAKAGLDRDRAEREIVRMLAMDYLTEPRAGSYRVLST